MSEKRDTKDWTIKEYHTMVFKRIRVYSNPDGIWGNNDSSFEGIVESVNSYTDCQNVPRYLLEVIPCRGIFERFPHYSVHPHLFYFIEVFEKVTEEELLTHSSRRLRELCLEAYGR